MIGVKESVLMDIIISFAPFLILWLIIGMFARRMTGSMGTGMGNIFGVGQSKAKRYMQKETGVTFKDVAGEDEAKERHVMTMQDWINATDDLLKFRRKKVLNNSDNISHKDAVEKAESEYEKYRLIQDQKYVSSMDEFYNKYLEENETNNK